MTLGEYIQIATSILVLLVLIVNIYRASTKPDIEASERLTKIEQACPLRHAQLDKDINTMTQNLVLIKENDLKHIESECRRMSEAQVKILTILEERNIDKTNK